MVKESKDRKEENVDNNKLDQELEQQLEHIDADAARESTDAPSAGSSSHATSTTTSSQPTDEEQSADPFARLAKKKVAKPQSMQELMQKKVKKGRKVSPKFFLLGCGIFFILFLGLMFGGLYYAVSSAGVLESIGLEIEDVKSILLIFAVLFFGIIFFIGFYILVINIYRLITRKSKKGLYAGGLFLGLLVIIGTIIAGTMSINRINALAGKQEIISNNLVLTYVETKDGPVFAEEGIPLIAPLELSFKLNETSNADIIKEISNSIQRQQPYTVQLACGNGQTLYMNPTNRSFEGTCLYISKEQFNFTLQVETPDGEKEFDAAGFTPQAIIELEPIEDEAYLNDKKDEWIIGIAPVNVRFRGQKIFTDLGLKNDVIKWDLDGDGAVDLEDNATFEYPLDTSKLHTIYYQLPELNKRGSTWFRFDLRVVESELARCELSVDVLDDQKRIYRVTPSFDEPVQVASYHYTIYDERLGDLVEKIKSTTKNQKITFPAGGKYSISASYFTIDDKKGSCTSKAVDVGFKGNQVAFDLKWKQKINEPFVAIDEQSPVVLDTEQQEINVTTLPALLEFTITDIQPDPTADLKVYYNDRQIFPDREGVYEVSIESLGTKDMRFALETTQGDTSEQIYTINVSRSSVRARMKVEPDTVGEDPFTVTLDASISDLYIQDQEDEIVYFTRDFGDGETRENISQGKVQHTYRYDEDKNTGSYYPSVTVETKQGYTDTYRLQTPINVKKKQKEVAITVESHPTQQVKLGETVNYALTTDGVVESIQWDFGNGETYSCADRSCARSSMRYTTPGEYEITADVRYTDDVPVKGRVKIKVYE